MIRGENRKRKKNQWQQKDFNLVWIVLKSQEKEQDLWKHKFFFGYVDFDLLMGYQVINNWMRIGIRNI